MFVCCLQDAKQLSALLDVIAEPYHYFTFTNTTQTALPDSFERLLRAKVDRFFSWTLYPKLL